MFTQTLIILVFLIIVSVCDDKVAEFVKVNVDGKVNPTSLDIDLDPNERIEQKLEALHAQIMELQNTVLKQQNVINDLNETLQTFVFTSSDEYGVIYDKSDDRPLLLTSAHSHDIPFVMLKVVSVRLPKRDAYYVKDKRNKKGRALGKKAGKKSNKKTRYAHVIITLSRDGIFQLWDDEQNEIYTYFDSNILLNNDEMSDDGMSDDELINSNKNFIVYSDVVTQTKFGNTWYVVARNDASFVKVYAVTAWRDYINDKVNDKIRRSIISGQINPENTIYRPSDKELNQIQETAKKSKKKPFRMSAAVRHKQGKNKKSQNDDDVNEFDVDDTSITDKKQECKQDEKKECKQEEEREKETEEEIIETKNATVTGVAVYHHQKKQYIIVSYSDGKIFSFKPNGQLASSSSSIPYQSPNKTIVQITRTKKKYELLVVTEIGFQFLKLPKLTKSGPFCNLPANTIINNIEFDETSSTLMYMATNDGKILVYNTKKLNKKLCKSLDSFTVEPNSPLQIETLPGYLLITSNQGLNVYNVSKKKTAQYVRPGLLFLRKFEDEFGSNDDRLSGSNVMVSSYTDSQQRTVIAYAQSATNVSMDKHQDENNDNPISYRFVVMESYLPSFKANASEKGGILGIISKAPIFVGIAMFAFFWVFFKGKGGNQSFGNSPLGRLGKIFGGKKGGRRYPSNRGDVQGKMDRWQSKHGGSLSRGASGGGGGGRNGAPKQSANMRYSQSASRKPYGGSGISGKTYRRSLGRTGGDWSD